MNIYELHSRPEELEGYAERMYHVPEIAYIRLEHFPDDERAIDCIAKDAKWSYWYAKDILHGRFPAGEPEIAKNAGMSYNYALDVIKGRFPAGEPELAKNIYLAGRYAVDVINGRFRAAEPNIRKYMDMSKEEMNAASNRGDHVLSKDIRYARFYKRDVLHEPI